jgi:hypothetical protein
MAATGSTGKTPAIPTTDNGSAITDVDVVIMAIREMAADTTTTTTGMAMVMVTAMEEDVNSVGSYIAEKAGITRLFYFVPKSLLTSS